MLLPTTGCSFILVYSLSVKAEGLFRMYSGMAILPIS
jgi:hypothetical protein